MMATVVWATAFGSQAADGPRISFANPVYDFGTINAGKTFEHRYWFTNTGSKTLEITNVHSTCGCTTLDGWPRKVEPGEAGSIAIKFNSTKIIGIVHKAVVVYSTDQAQPITELTVKGRVGKPIDFNPKWVYLTGAAGTNPLPLQVVSITNSANEPLAVHSLQSSNGAFSGKIITNIAGSDYRIEIAAVRPLPMGVTRGEISVRTSSPDMPSIVIPTMVHIQSAVNVMPAAVSLPAAPLANAVTNTLVVQYTGSGALNLSNPRLSVPGATVQTRALQPGRIYQVVLGFPAGFSAKAGCQFTVNTSDPEQPLVSVPVTHAQSTAR